MLIDKAKDYCENDKERLREQARNKYRNLSEEEKTKRENMEKKKKYRSMSNEKNIKKNYREAKKPQYNNQ